MIEVAWALFTQPLPLILLAIVLVACLSTTKGSGR